MTLPLCGSDLHIFSRKHGLELFAVNIEVPYESYDSITSNVVARWLSRLKLIWFSHHEHVPGEWILLPEVDDSNIDTL
jgi:hypothetical protein